MPWRLATSRSSLVVRGQLDRDGLEAVAGDVEPRRVVEDVRLEHQLVVGVGLDQDDVDARVALLPLARHLVQALVGEQLERLVGDLREAHVRDPAHARAEQRRDLLREVVHVRHERVDDDDELRAGLDRDVEVRGGDDPAVDELAVAAPGPARRPSAAPPRRARPRRSGCRPSPRRRARSARTCPGRSPRGRARAEQPEVVGAARVGEHGAHVLLDARSPSRARTAARRRARCRGRRWRTSRGCGRA